MRAQGGTRPGSCRSQGRAVREHPDTPWCRQSRIATQREVKLPDHNGSPDGQGKIWPIIRFIFCDLERRASLILEINFQCVSEVGAPTGGVPANCLAKANGHDQTATQEENNISYAKQAEPSLVSQQGQSSVCGGRLPHRADWAQS